MLAAAPLAQAVRARLVLEQVLLNPARQSATFIGQRNSSTRTELASSRRRTGLSFHVEHSVDGDELRPLNLWRIVYLTDRPEQKLIERFTLAKKCGCVSSSKSTFGGT